MKAKKKKRQKTHAQKVHFKKRMYQRFGFEPTEAEIKEMIEEIQGQRAFFVDSQSRTRSVYQMEVRGHTIRVIYDKLRHNLVTALYPPTLLCKRCFIKEATCQGGLCFSCDDLDAGRF